MILYQLLFKENLMETYFDPELNENPNVSYSIIDMKKVM